MAVIQSINLGTGPDTGTGDPIRTGGTKINTNFTNLNTDKLEKALLDARIFVGNASNVATGVILSGGATISNAGVLTLSNTAVTGQAITGFVSGAGTLSPTDTILQAIQKLDGNITTESLWDKSGIGLIPQTVGDSIGLTGTRISKGWFTDLEITNYPTINGTAISNQTLRTTDSPTFNDVNVATVTASGASGLKLGNDSDNLLNINDDGSISFFDGLTANNLIRLSGYITAATGIKFISHAVLDTDDYYHIARQDANILGTKIDMPLAVTTLTVANGIVQTDANGLFSSSVTLPDGTLATTQAPGDNTTKLATTAFVTAAVTAEDLWDRTVTTLSPKTAGDDVSIGTGLLKDNDVTAGIALGDASNTGLSNIFATASILGGINENKTYRQNTPAYSASITLTDSDMSQIWSIDTSGGNVTLTIPDTSAANNGRWLRIYKRTSDANTISISTTTSQQIDGTTIQNITLPNKGFTIVSQNINSKYIIIQDNRFAAAQPSGVFSYFLTNTASDIGGYLQMEVNATGEGESTASSASLGIGNNQLVEEWATISTEPTFTNLLAGVYNFHFDVAKTAGSRNATIYYNLYKRTSGGVETLLGTSEVSPLITSRVTLDLELTLDSDVILNTTDRLVVKIFANVSGGGSDVIITVYMEGTTASRFSLPANTAIFDARYLVKTGLSSGQSVFGGTGAGDNITFNTTTNVTKGSYIFSDVTSASRLSYFDASKGLQSVADLTVWVAGTANKITVTDDTDGTITLSLPLSIKVDAITESTVDNGITIEGLHYEDDYINKSGITNQGLTFNSSDIATFTEDLNVTGNLFVNGNKVAVDSRISTSDYILAMNFGETSSVVTSGRSGIETDRGSGNPYVNMFFEANDDYRVGIYYTTVNYTGKTGTFNLNNEILGATSGANGYVVSDSGSALILKVVKGTFVDTETINNQTVSGSATVSGAPVVTNNTQAVATRQDFPTDTGIAFWDTSTFKFNTSSSLLWNGSLLRLAGSLNIGSNGFTKATLGTGDIALDNGTTTTPRIKYYYANTNGFGIHAESGVGLIVSQFISDVPTNKIIVDNSGLNIVAGNIRNTSGSLTITPNAGTNLNINLLTTGDFVVNSNQIYADTSSGYVGFGASALFGRVHISDANAIILQNTANTVDKRIFRFLNYSVSNSLIFQALNDAGTFLRNLISFAHDGTITANQNMIFQAGINVQSSDILLTGSLGATGTRVTKGWFTDLEITNYPTVGGISIASTGLFALSNGEVLQLANIDSAIINATQWGYLGASNQGIATTNNVTFNSVTTSLLDYSGTLSIGITNASAINIGKSGQTTAILGALTVAQNLTISGQEIGIAPVLAAGTIPVDTDVSSWGNNKMGFVIGTGGRVFLTWKNITDVYYVEATAI